MSITNVILFYQSDVRFGGWPTDTVHLYYGLRAAGVNPILVRASERENQKEKSFGRGLSIHEVPLRDACGWARKYPSFVVVSAPKQAPFTTELVKAGASLLVHDPTEWKGGCLDESFEASKKPILVHRKSVAKQLDVMGHESDLILHPYHPVGVGAGKEVPPLSERHWHAVAISRVDFDKRTHTIVEANGLMEEDKRVQIHGALNRIYEYHQLRKMHPEWKRYYHGEFVSDSVWAGVGICQTAKVMVDMSVIKGDGGGTQLTTLEGLDAGCALVLNEEWLTGDPEVDEVENVATFVKEPEELAMAVLEEKQPDKEAVRELFERHSAEKIGKQLLEVLV